VSGSGSEAGRWRFALVFFALAALGCLSRDIASLPPPIARFAAAAGLVACTVAWAGRRRRSPLSSEGVVLALVGVVGVIASPWPALRLMAVAVWIGGLGFALGNAEERRFAAGPICAAFALALLDLVPALRLSVGQASTGLSRIVLAAFGGGSFSGASGGLAALFALLIARAAVPQRRAKRRLALIGPLVLVALFLGQLIVQRQISAVGARIACSGASFLLGALTVAGFAAVFPANPLTSAPRRAGGAVLAGFAALCLALPISLATVEGLRDAARRPQRVLLFDVAMLADYRTPADKPLGQAFTGASFGSLPLYLRAYGHDCSVAAAVDPSLALRADVVVVINPGRPFTPTEQEVLLAFVRAGGGLLALADHTDIGGLMASFNELLAPTGLWLNFDSAVSARHEWRGSLVVPYPESVFFRDADVPVSIGASVSGRGGSAGDRPLLLGMDSFSDPGDRSNEQAFLGNLAFDPGEDYGDIVLAVERPLGRGRIALFGDTSIFQNLSLASSAAYVDRLVRRLGGGAGIPTALSLAAAILGVALLLAAARRSAGGVSLLIVALALAAGTAAADLVLARACAVHVPELGTIGVIDVSHSNLVDRQALAAAGIDALVASVARTGVLPVVWDRPGVPAPLGSGDLWVTVAPTRAYSAVEVRGLRAAAAEGTALIVGTRWPYSAAVAPLVEPLGLTVTNVPLGAARPSMEGLADAPELGSAWALDADETWTIIGRSSLGEESFPVAAERSLGRGRVAVVTDTEVFTNEALEGKGYAYVENVRFVERLLRGEVTP